MERAWGFGPLPGLAAPGALRDGEGSRARSDVLLVGVGVERLQLRRSLGVGDRLRIRILCRGRRGLRHRGGLGSRRLARRRWRRGVSQQEVLQSPDPLGGEHRLLHRGPGGLVHPRDLQRQDPEGGEGVEPGHRKRQREEQRQGELPATVAADEAGVQLVVVRVVHPAPLRCGTHLGGGGDARQRRLGSPRPGEHLLHRPGIHRSGDGQVEVGEELREVGGVGRLGGHGRPEERKEIGKHLRPAPLGHPLAPDEGLGGHLADPDQLLQRALGHRPHLGAAPANQLRAAALHHHRRGHGDGGPAGHSTRSPADAGPSSKRGCPHLSQKKVKRQSAVSGRTIVPALSVDLGGTGDLHRRLSCPLGKGESMPAKDLGAKHVCFKCGTKFYDLRKPETVCPKCGADQKDSPANRPAPEPRRSRLAAVLKAVEPVGRRLGDRRAEDLGAHAEGEEGSPGTTGLTSPGRRRGSPASPGILRGLGLIGPRDAAPPASPGILKGD